MGLIGIVYTLKLVDLHVEGFLVISDVLHLSHKLCALDVIALDLLKDNFDGGVFI
jgi:hypothetical protein